MINKEEDLKLIYVHKVGYNSKGEGLIEFIFSHDENNIDVEAWCWDLSPACDNATPPTKEYIDKVISLKTTTFDLFCLSEAVDREYMHGYHTIHCLAYETARMIDDDSNDYEKMFEENADSGLPLLVFHYGMSLAKIKDMFAERKIILKKDEFIETSNIDL